MVGVSQVFPYLVLREYLFTYIVMVRFILINLLERIIFYVCIFKNVIMNVFFVIDGICERDYIMPEEMIISVLSL